MTKRKVLAETSSSNSQLSDDRESFEEAVVAKKSKRVSALSCTQLRDFGTQDDKDVFHSYYVIPRITKNFF